MVLVVVEYVNAQAAHLLASQGWHIRHIAGRMWEARHLVHIVMGRG